MMPTRPPPAPPAGSWRWSSPGGAPDALDEGRHLLVTDQPQRPLLAAAAEEQRRRWPDDAKPLHQGLVDRVVCGDIGLEQDETGQRGVHGGSAKVYFSISLQLTHQSA